jgi:hypothetical protein
MSKIACRQLHLGQWWLPMDYQWIIRTTGPFGEQLCVGSTLWLLRELAALRVAAEKSLIGSGASRAEEVADDDEGLTDRAFTNLVRLQIMAKFAEEAKVPLVTTPSETRIYARRWAGLGH